MSVAGEEEIPYFTMNWMRFWARGLHQDHQSCWTLEAINAHVKKVYTIVIMEHKNFIIFMVDITEVLRQDSCADDSNVELSESPPATATKTDSEDLPAFSSTSNSESNSRLEVNQVPYYQDVIVKRVR